VKKFRTTFIALAVVLVLALYMVYTGREEPTKEADDLTIFGATLDEIKRIQIHHSDHRLTVEKASDLTWVVDTPLNYEISQEAVNTLVAAVAGGRFEKEIESDPYDLDAFGLATPNTRIVVERERKGSKTLLVGSATPVGSGYYVKNEDDNRVWVISSALADALVKTVDDLREKKIVKEPTGSFDGIRIVKRIEDDITDVICQKHGEDWYLKQPITDKANKELINRILAEVAGLTVEDFVDDEGSDLSIWGLNRPRLRIDLTIEGRGMPFQLFVGNPGPGDEGFYIKTGDSPSVYLVKPSYFSALEVTPPELVANRLIQWDHTGTDASAFWTLDGKSSPVVSSGLDIILDALQDIRIIGVGESLEYDLDLDSFGLSDPSIRVELDIGDGDIFEVKVGNEIDQGFYATSTGRNYVYLVAKEGVKALQQVLIDISSSG
jgi:hypothetical protein